jgi:hypothetical protein
MYKTSVSVATASCVTSAADARDGARDFLEALGRPAIAAQVADTVVLVVPELLTNALRHGGGTCTLDLSAHPYDIEVAVHDGSPQPPRMRTPDLNGATEGSAGPRSTDSPPPPPSPATRPAARPSAPSSPGKSLLPFLFRQLRKSPTDLHQAPESGGCFGRVESNPTTGSSKTITDHSRDRGAGRAVQLGERGVRQSQSARSARCWRHGASRSPTVPGCGCVPWRTCSPTRRPRRSGCGSAEGDPGPQAQGQPARTAGLRLRQEEAEHHQDHHDQDSQGRLL